MSRSLKKGPFIDFKLERKVLVMNESNKKSVVKTWARRSMISPDFVGHTIAVHNGNKFIPVFVTENNGEVYVYVVENNIAKKVPVETGIESGENIEIISGLTTDMQVVVKGQTYITDGEEVNVSNPEEDVLRVPVEGAQVQSEGE